MAVRPLKDGRSLYVVCRICGNLVGGVLASLRDHLRDHDMAWAQSLTSSEVLLEFDERKREGDEVCS